MIEFSNINRGSEKRNKSFAYVRMNQITTFPPQYFKFLVEVGNETQCKSMYFTQ